MTTERRRRSITLKLVSAFLIPTVLLFFVFSVLVYRFVKADLEESLGRRLIGIAASAATQLRGDYLGGLVAGDEEDVRFQSALRKLKNVQSETRVSRLYVFDSEFEIKVDSLTDSIGGKQYQAELDRAEIMNLQASAKPVSSLLFEGHNEVLYKAGYAPVFENRNERTVRLILGVDAPADFFQQLKKLRQRLWTYGAVLALSVIGIAIWFASRLTRPLRNLATAAERIGRGELDAAIPTTAKDEIGVLGHTMDRMRSDLKARNEHMHMMLAGIAHEVRNPLGGMELYAGILKDELSGDDEKQNHVAKIQRELDYLKKVVENFLEYARRPGSSLLTIDLSRLTRDVCDLLKGEAESKGISMSLSSSPLTVIADEHQLRRVIVNLIQNAIQAVGGDSPEITVRLSDEGGGMLAVHNTGAAIKPEILNRMFEPFYTTREKGTGLGLAFARDIVNEHGAQLRVDSREGFGTEFQIVFKES